VINQVLQKIMLHLDLYNCEPQIMVDKYIAPTHLGEYSIVFLYVEIVIYNCAFFKNHQSILRTLPPFVVEMTYVMHVFLLFSK
jgi:hypothetical protein